MKGIDISDNQGIIKWNEVKAAGVEFVILRTTRRSGQPDKYLASNIKSLLEFQIPFDFYKYSYATTIAEAATEAKGVIDTLIGYGVVPDRDTIIYMDVEDKVQFALSTEQLTQIVKAWKKTVEDAGYTFGLYMGKYAYEHNEIDLSQFNDLTWLARYYNGYNKMEFGVDPDEAYKPNIKSGQLKGWQFTSSGQVPGISGNVDMNVYYGDLHQTKVEVEYYSTPEFTLIDALNKIGVDSSYNNRKSIARINGIQSYTGKKEENLRLYELLKEGKLAK